MRISESLIQDKLIACSNIYRSMSVYTWEGKLENQPEHVMVAKALPANVEKAKKKILELHSYDVPAILTWEADSLNPKYDEWVKN